MKIRCQRGKFVPLFMLIANFASTKDVRPILQNVKLIVDESNLLLMATDGEVGARGEINVQDAIGVERPGEAILPTKLLRKIFTETTDEEILLESEGTRLTVKGLHFRYQLDTADEADKFPAIAPFPEGACFKISTNSLNRMSRRTVFATETTNSHYELRGVKFVFGEEKTIAVATDGRRLAYQECASEFLAGDPAVAFEEKQAIFSTRALNLIERVDSDVDDALVVLRDSEAQIKIGSVVVSTTLMTGRFPDWNAIIPDKNQKKRVDFIASDLARAIRQAEIVATENKPGVWFKFEPGKVNVTANGDATGESSVELPIAYDGETAELRLDSRFLNEFFREVPPDETVAFYFLQDYRTLFETTDGYRYVVMQLA